MTDRGWCGRSARMDGSLTLEDLVAAVAGDCSAGRSEVEQVVDFLIQSG